MWQLGRRALVGGAADECSTRQNGLNRGHEVIGDAGFRDKPGGAQRKSFLHEFGRRFLGYEDDFGIERECANLAGDVEPIERGEPDVEENEGGLEFCGLADGFLAVGDFGDDLQVRFAFEKDANQVPKGCEVLDQKDADGEILHGVGAQLRN